MNRKAALDTAIVLSGITGMILSYAYLENPVEKQASLVVLGIISFLFFLLAAADWNRPGRVPDIRPGYIVYDAKQGQTVLLPGDSNGIVYMNDEAVYVPTQLNLYDVIEMSESKFLFILFCGEHFKWE